jgi:hypothetical protein
MPDDFVIALDVDNVILNFDAHWIACAEETLQRPVPQLNDTYSLSSRFGTTAEETALIWENFDAHWMATVPAYPTSAKMIADLRELGASLWAVSSVYATAHDARCESLSGLIPADRIICIGSPNAHPSKAPVLQRIGARALLDDLPTHVRDAQAVMKYPVLLDQHYSGLDTSDIANVVQTHSEFVEFCRETVLPSVELSRQEASVCAED